MSSHTKLTFLAHQLAAKHPSDETTEDESAEFELEELSADEKRFTFYMCYFFFKYIKTIHRKRSQGACSWPRTQVRTLLSTRTTPRVRHSGLCPNRGRGAGPAL